MSVAELLTQARAVHRRAVPVGKHAPRQWDVTLPLWRESLALRIQAHEMDPKHEDPAWYLGPPAGYDNHADVLALYASKGVTL